MQYYLVNINIYRYDENYKFIRENFNCRMESETLSESRSKAIEMAKSLIVYFENGILIEQNFNVCEKIMNIDVSEIESYSVDIIFSDGEDFYSIMGSELDLKFDWLQFEANFYKENLVPVKFIKAENLNGDMIEVIEDDLEFLIAN